MEGDPEWDSSASIRRIAPPAAAASRRSLAKEGAYTQFSAYPNFMPAEATARSTASHSLTTCRNM